MDGAIKVCQYQTIAYWNGVSGEPHSHGSVLCVLLYIDVLLAGIALHLGSIEPLYFKSECV